MTSGSPPAPLRPTIATPLSIDPLDHPVQNKAYPGIYQQPEINLEWLMPSRARQMRHQNEKVEHVANDDGHELLEEFTKHAIVVHRKTVASS
jgi:hypothetical protein